MWVRFPPGTYQRAPLVMITQRTLNALVRLIRSLPLAHPFRGFVYVAPLPRAPFPPGTWQRAPLVMITQRTLNALVRLIRSLPLAHPLSGLRLCRTAPAGSIPAGDI